MRYCAMKNGARKYAGFMLVYHGPGSTKVRRWLVEANAANGAPEIFGEPDAK